MNRALRVNFMARCKVCRGWCCKVSMFSGHLHLGINVYEPHLKTPNVLPAHCEKHPLLTLAQQGIRRRRAVNILWRCEQKHWMCAASLNMIRLKRPQRSEEGQHRRGQRARHPTPHSSSSSSSIRLRQGHTDHVLWGHKNDMLGGERGWRKGERISGRQSGWCCSLRLRGVKG